MIRLIAIVILCSATLAAQSPLPGAVKLLPQYEHLPASGKKAGKAGVIQRANGPRIEYEFGISPPESNAAQTAYSAQSDEADTAHLPSTPDFVTAPMNAPSIEESTSIAGRPVRFISLRYQRGLEASLYFTSDKLRFRSPYANSQQLAEFLLTALSYPARPSQPGFLRIPFRRIKLEKDPANALITHGQVTHTVGTGSSGTISQPGEPPIHYQVGAPPPPLADWSLKQDFIGHPVTVSLAADSGQKTSTLQIVFMPQPGSDADPVTFRAPIRNYADFVHVMMTVLTYHQ